MAEALPVGNASTDLALFYLTFIDIADIGAAIREATRILRPGGHLLVANLAGFITAAHHDGFSRNPDDSGTFHMRDYLHEDSYRTHWRGIDITNHHRPPSTYMQLLLKAGLILTHYDEPPSTHPDPKIRAGLNHVAYFTVMEWQKPA